MHNAHLLKGSEALNAFIQAVYDLENLEPEVSGMLVNGSINQRKASQAQIKNLQRVLIKLKFAKEGTNHGR